MCTLTEKIRSKIAKIKKLVTRTPGSTKRTNRVASKNHTSGIDKNFFLSDLISRGLRGKHTEKSDQNSGKNFSVLAGLTYPISDKQIFQDTTVYWILFINVTLILKMREIKFFAGKIHNGTLQRIFRGPREISIEMPHYVVYFAKQKKFQIFSKISRTLVILCIRATVCPNFFHFIDVHSFLESLEENLCWKCAKNIAKIC